MITHTNIATIENAVRELTEWLGRVAQVVAPPVLRIALAIPFFKSGWLKWDGFLSLSPAAAYLFEDEFKLHLFGQAYDRSEEHTSELQSQSNLVCRLLLE